MTTPWETETEEPTVPFGKDDWDNMSVANRAIKAKESGLEGKLGAKLWDDLTPGEKTTIMHPEERPVQQEYQIKAHVALESSDSQMWGVARDVEGSYTWKPGEGQIVGTWSRSPADGLVHVFLETPLTALMDKATQNFVRLAEKREAEKREADTSSKTRKTRTPKREKPAEEPDEALTAIENIRKLLNK